MAYLLYHRCKALHVIPDHLDSVQLRPRGDFLSLRAVSDVTDDFLMIVLSLLFGLTSPFDVIPQAFQLSWPSVIKKMTQRDKKIHTVNR